MIVVVVGAVGFLGLGFLLYAGLLADAWVGVYTPGAGAGSSGIDVFRPIVLVLWAVAFVALLFRVLPPRRLGWRRILLGACVVVALWVAGTACLSYYIDAVSAVNPIYASLGGIIGVMIFFYFFALAIVLGFELVAELEASAARREQAATPRSPARP
jgi:membrane protein